jgi:hypothetical protein
VSIIRVLDTSVGVSGPHDFAVRHRISHRAQKRLTRQRPSHSLSNVRDDAYAPHPDRNGQTIKLILAGREAIYFFGKGWTMSRALKGLAKLVFRRRGIWAIPDVVGNVAVQQLPPRPGIWSRTGGLKFEGDCPAASEVLSVDGAASISA